MFDKINEWRSAFGRRALAYAAILPSVRKAIHDEYDRVAESERSAAQFHSDRAVAMTAKDTAREVVRMLTREIEHIERHAPGRRALKALVMMRGRVERRFCPTILVDNSPFAAYYYDNGEEKQEPSGCHQRPARTSGRGVRPDGEGG